MPRKIQVLIFVLAFTNCIGIGAGTVFSDIVPDHSVASITWNSDAGTFQFESAGDTLSDFEDFALTGLGEYTIPRNVMVDASKSKAETESIFDNSFRVIVPAVDSIGIGILDFDSRKTVESANKCVGIEVAMIDEFAGEIVNLNDDSGYLGISPERVLSNLNLASNYCLVALDPGSFSNVSEEVFLNDFAFEGGDSTAFLAEIVSDLSLFGCVIIGACVCLAWFGSKI